ncbi:Uma2 family endonuclease [Afifella pfennigii]|uniref:Uma2 family endonuclease n=1 Tax=Afifella pfennigii TaxID=209897 RepID=UPI00047DA8DA|nr:Uma2 family endonuclease [Afifella pfennigii]
MAEPAKRGATYADLEAVPPHLVGEIIDGELVTHPRPAPKHGAASSALGMKLAEFQMGGGGPGGWLFIDEPELHLGSDVVVPDIAGWRRERLTALPDTPYMETAPDWVCEVISPSTEAYDRGPKRRIYARAGIAHLWLLDPRLKLLETFALTGGNWTLLGDFSGEDAVSAPPFDAITFSLGVLWPLDAPADTPPSDNT